MPEINEWERGTARMKLDQFKICDREVSRAVVDGLTAAGYDVEIAPGFDFNNPRAEPEQKGDILTVFQKVG